MKAVAASLRKRDVGLINRDLLIGEATGIRNVITLG